MKFIDDEPDVPAQINIVSAIDVIFAILAFFIISSLFLSRNEGLPVNLPQADSSQIQEEAQVAVTVTSDGEIRVNADTVELDELKASVETVMDDIGTNIVVLNADEEIPHGQAIAILDRLRQIDNVRLAIATQSESESDESEE